MAHYRAYLLDECRHVISAANFHCADEQEARERALQLVDANDVELWQLDRRIAVFEAAKPKARTRRDLEDLKVRREKSPLRPGIAD